MKRLFKDVFTELREESGLNQSDLANELGLTRQSISNYETGKRVPGDDVRELIADYFNVDMDFLMGRTSRKNKYRESFNIENIPGVIIPQKLKKIPILGTIACGEPIFAQENYDGYFILDSSMTSADFILRAQGDSMIEANINDGDLVFLRKTPDVENGAIAAVLIENEATLKRINKSGNSIILQPCNKNYSPIIVNERDNKSVMILGEMVGVYSPRSR